MSSKGPRTLDLLHAHSWMELIAEEEFGINSSSYNQQVVDFLKSSNALDSSKIVNKFLGESSSFSIRFVVKSDLKNIEFLELVRRFQMNSENSSQNSEYLRMMISVLVRGSEYTPSKHELENAVARIVYLSLAKLLKMRRFVQAEELASFGAIQIAAVMLLVDGGEM